MSIYIFPTKESLVQDEDSMNRTILVCSQDEDSMNHTSQEWLSGVHLFTMFSRKLTFYKILRDSWWSMQVRSG